MSCAALLWLTAELLVLHKGDSSLGFYTPEGRMTAKVKLKLNPHEMALSADRRFAYITENGTMRIENIAAGGNSVAMVDLAKRKKVAEISTGTFRRPHGIWFSRGDVYVTTEAPDQVLRLRDRKIERAYSGVGRIAHMVSVTPDGRLAIASNSGSGTVSLLDTATCAVENLETGKRPEGSVVSSDGREAYVTNRESNTISVIDLTTRKVVSQIETGKGPVRIGLTPDGVTLVYALMAEHAIGFADVKSRREVARVPVEGMPISLHLSDDGARAYAASEEIDSVHVVDVAARKLIRSFKTATGFAPDPVMQLDRP
ncbi:MAG: hypothetical protein SFV18_01765 [Bryobacteraceae bacterium]|nr:hypothetical protein [Bryobacteraceae bacterium]